MLLISDLHLQAGRDDITAALLRFLRETAPASAQLYILGDLFEAWIGDDASDALADRVAAALAELADQHVEIFLLHGNRDFLLGDGFAARCGGRLLSEPHLLQAGEHRIALLHGDTLCTADTAYQQVRRMVRDPAWQADFLSRSPADRRAFAAQAREQSKAATSMAAAEIMDVSQSAVIDLMRSLNVDTLIHGHTHRPAIHRVDFPGPDNLSSGTRMVLGDWDKAGWYGKVDAQGKVSLHRFKLAD